MSATDQPAARKPHPLGLLHRYGGLTAALFVLLLCITGILLNHSDTLRLHERFISNRWLLSVYGVAEPELLTYRAGDQYVSAAGMQLYLDDRHIGTLNSGLHGVASQVDETVGRIITIFDGHLQHLYTADGQLIEILNIGPDDSPHVAALPQVELPSPLRRAVLEHYRGAGISLQQLILDIHSGRLAGQSGTFLADAIAVLFSALVVSGIWMWSKTRRRGS